MSDRNAITRQIAGIMEHEIAPISGERLSLAQIEQRMQELSDETQKLVKEASDAGDAAAYTLQLKAVMEEAAALKEKRAFLEQQRKTDAHAAQRLESLNSALAQTPHELTEWEEPLIRQIVEMVTVMSAEKITVQIRGGGRIEQNILK